MDNDTEAGVVFKLRYRDLAKSLNTFWRKNDRYKPVTTRNTAFFCERDDRQKVTHNSGKYRRNAREKYLWLR